MESALAEYLSHAPVFVRTLEGHITLWSQGAEELYGYAREEAIGRVSHDLLKTEFPAPLADINAQLVARGDWQGLLSHQPKRGARLWTESQWRLRDGAHGLVVVEINTDVTERETLSRELTHRLKNTLSVVQGLARASLTDCAPASLQRFEQRLQTLSAANDLLLRRHWKSAEIGEVIAVVVARFGAGARVSTKGPSVLLPANSAFSYGLALHELMTNALKYGALSTPMGRVRIDWSRSGARLQLTWREQGGPPVTPPKRTGFGLRLVQRAITLGCDATVQVRFEPTGLVCEIDSPIDACPVGEALAPELQRSAV